MAMPHDDCFVMMSDRGEFWDGSRWVVDYRAARQFTAPPLVDPWLACERACRELQTAIGRYCVPAFFPASEVTIAQG